MRNIIITNISALPSKPKEEIKLQIFASDLGDITGLYTNEAPIKYLLTYISQKNESADLIIAAKTPEAESAYVEFKKVVNDFAEEKGIKVPEIIPVAAAENEMEKAVDQITKLVAENDHVYIDTTGGFRNSSYLLMAVVRVLEYAGIGLTKAIYTKAFGDKQIIDITSVYRMFDLINAVNIFSQIGDSRQLEEYFKDQDNEVVKRTIGAMNSFSDEISLCRTSKLDEVLIKMNDCLTELSEMKTDSKDVMLLKSLSDTIKKKFGCTNDKIDYPDIVKWCLDNKMIQQAVTIYVEKMPEYFYKKGYYTVTDEKLETIRKKNEKSHNDLYYELFYSNLLVDYDSGNDKISNIFSEVAEAVPKNDNNLSKYDSKKTTIHSILNALVECSDFDHFIRRTSHKSFKKYEFESISSEMKRFFKVRNAFYSDNKLRSMEEIEKRLDNFPEIARLFNEKKYSYPNSIEGFIGSINNNKPLSKAIFHPDLIQKYEDNHLSCLEAISDNNTETDYNLSDKLSKQQLQNIFRNIYYAKTFIRNKLNHASEDESTTEEMKEYFKINGYPVDNELNVRTIREFLSNAIQKLEL